MADQKRDSSGRFGSAGSRSEYNSEEANRNPALEQPEGEGRRGKPWPPKPSAEDEAPATLQGEAGRQARKQARDCMSGRYRQ